MQLSPCQQHAVNMTRGSLRHCCAMRHSAQCAFQVRSQILLLMSSPLLLLLLVAACAAIPAVPLQGLSCAEFQKLPKKLHSAAGAGVFDLAQSKNWKRCPKCGHMVERNTGCDYMTCRCKAHFCYACGGSFKKGRCLCKGR